MTMTNMRPFTEWFFRAPLEDIAMRRGDPLGMRSVAEELAEALAPGLSNRTVDARWISILCLVLDQGHAAWDAFGASSHGDTMINRNAAKELYSWVRPLEMLWLARTVKLTEEQGGGR